MSGPLKTCHRHLRQVLSARAIVAVRPEQRGHSARRPLLLRRRPIVLADHQ